MGTTVVDALLVTLGLDAKDFAKGVEVANKAQKKLADGAAAGGKSINDLEKKLAEEQKRRIKEMEDRAKTVARGFHKIRVEALSLLAVFTAGVGLKNFVQNTIDTAAGLDRMSSNLGMSAKDLSMWQLAAKNAGGTAEGMTEQLKDAATELAKFQNGGNSEKILSLLKWGAMSGVDIDINQLKTGTDVVMARAKVLEALNRQNPAKALMAASEIGVGDGAYPLMKQGPEAIERIRQAQSKLADEYARSSREAEVLRQKLDTLKNNLELVGLKIASRLMPHLEHFSDWVNAHQDQIAKFADKLAEDIEKIAKQANAAAEAVGGWTNVLLIFAGVKLAGVVAEIWGAVTAFKALSAAKAALTANAAAGAAAEGAGGAAAAGGGFLAKAFPWLARAGVFAGLMLHSGGLNEGEDAELARRRGAVGNVNPQALFGNLEDKYHLPPGMLDSVWLQESSRGRNMLSPKGAKGHFGFMDATARQYGLSDPNDLASSADAAARMLSDLLRKYRGDATLALAGYNWGQGNVDRLGLSRAGPETQNYVTQVLGRIRASALSASTAPSSASTSTTDVKIDQITVQTQATDATGIAKDIGAAVMSHSFVTQANNGVN